MSAPPGRLLRRLASLLVRGPDAPYVLGDLEEGMRRDLARGMSVRRARIRYLVNVLASAVSLARVRLPVRRLLLAGPSWIDVKLGWRMLRKNPVLTGVALMSLAIGIPVGMAPVHVMDAFDAPPPVEDGDRLMGLRYRGGRGGLATTSYELDAWRNGLGSFETLSAMRRVEYNLEAEGGVGAPVAAAEVTASAFAALSTRPRLGRPIQAADERAGAPPVAVLGYDVWRSRFQADPGVIGSTVRVSGIPHTVVGVMPEGFRFPVWEGLWIPLRDELASEPGQGVPLQVFGSLAEGVSAATAQAEVTAALSGMSDHHPGFYSPESYNRVRVEVVSLSAMWLGLPKGGMRAVPGIGPFSALFLFQAVALVLLVVACVNVGLLIFARTATRSAELSVRTALGASRLRLVAQVATEALVLALIATGAGLMAVELLSDRILGALTPSWGGLPWWMDLGVDPTTVGRALALAGFSAVAAAGFPALRVTGADLRGNLRPGAADGFGIRVGRLWGALIVADVALAVAAVGLTIGIGTRMAEVASAGEMDDIPAEEYLAVRLELPGAAPDSATALERRARLADVQHRLLRRLRAEPRVRGVAAAERLPRMDHEGRRVEVEEGPDSVVEFVQVHPGFFDAFDRPILAGRGFDTRDLAQETAAPDAIHRGVRSSVIVNASFARELLGGRNPVGRRIRYVFSLDGEPGPWMEIVGVVGDLGTDLMRQDGSANVYHAAAPGEIDPLWLAVHVGPNPASFTPQLRDLAARVDPELLVVPAGRLSDVYPEGWYLMTGLLVAWMLFVGVLLALAASGVYAIMAFAVAQRTREIGIRTALGARRGDIVATIGRRAAFQLGLGAVLGMPVAGWIYFQLRDDPAATLEAFAVAMLPGLALIALVGLLACTVPLRRALRIAPDEAIRGAV